MKIVATSGYFIWLHAGHIELLEKSKKLGDKLIVVVNNDTQQVMKYGQVIVPYEEREKILKSIKWVDQVVKSIDQDSTVCKTLAMLKPNIFAKGGDRFSKEIPEAEICDKYSIQIIDGLGEKIQSSSQLLNKWRRYLRS